MSSDIQYRGYLIEPSATWNRFVFSHKDYGGPGDSRLGDGFSVMDCKCQIDDQIDKESAQ